MKFDRKIIKFFRKNDGTIDKPLVILAWIAIFLFNLMLLFVELSIARH